MRTSTSAITAMILTAGTLGLGASASHATPGATTGASLTWKVHECAFTGAFVTLANTASDSCFSIREDQTVSGNVQKTSDGWQFSNGTGTYDSRTGKTDLAFDGSLRMGNVNRGNYYIELADPTVSIDTEGSGTLSATLLVKSPGQAVDNRGRVNVVDLANVPDGTDWTVTPPWTGVGTPDDSAPLEGKQFAASFVDSLDPNMRNWFQASSSAAATSSRAEYNSHKTPAPLRVSFAEKVWTPSLTVSNTAGLTAGETRTVTVRGSGFDPSKQGNGVAGMYVVFGPKPLDLPNGYDDPNVFGAAQYLPGGPDSNGEFETTLTITGKYTDGNKVAWSPTTTRMGVSTWAAHTRATTAWDAFNEITFIATGAQGPGTTSKPSKVRKVRVAKLKKNRVIIKWTQSIGRVNGVAGGYQVRISKPGKPTTFGKWKAAKKSTVTFSGLKRSGQYRVQVRAVNDLGVSKQVTLRFVKR